jgi:phosphoserine phosphatase RsbU/P
MSQNPTAPEHPPVDAVSDARSASQLIEDVSIGLSGSLNMRRTALRLLTMIRPRLADWSMVVVPGDRPGALMVVGDDAGFSTVVSHAAVGELRLGRLAMADFLRG